MIAPGAARIMRGCEAGIIIVGRDDCVREGAEELAPAQSLHVEIGAASVIYGHRLMLMWDARVPLPADLTGVRRCEYRRGDLPWEIGLEVMMTVKGFNDDAA